MTGEVDHTSVAEFIEYVRMLALFAARLRVRHSDKVLIDEIESAMLGDSSSAAVIDSLRQRRRLS